MTEEDRRIRRQIVEELVAQRIRDHAEGSTLARRFEAELDRLETRAGKVFAVLAGQQRTEGVIDREGVWHDLEPRDDSDAATLDAIERILNRLEQRA